MSLRTALSAMRRFVTAPNDPGISSLWHDGVDDVCSSATGHSCTGNPDNVTVEGWYKLTRPSTGFGLFFSLGAQAANAGIYIGADSAGTVTPAIHGYSGAAASQKILPNRWYHIAVRWVGGATKTLETWIDGVRRGGPTAFALSNPNFTAAFYTGKAAANPLPVIAHGVRVWKRLVTDAEIAVLARNGSIDRTSLDGEWLGNGGWSAGTTVTDTSGNGRNLTMSGALYVQDVPYRARPLIVPDTGGVAVGAKAARFNAATDGVTGASQCLTGDVSATILGWMKCSAFPTSGTLGIAFQTGTPALKNCLYGGIYLSGGVWYVAGGLYSVSLMADLYDGKLVPGRWYRVGLWYDTTTKTSALVINGTTRVQTQSAPNPADFTGIPRIGNATAGGVYPFPGEVCDVRVYSRRLTEAEFAADFLRRRVDPTGLVRWWPLNSVGATTPELIGATADAVVGATQVTGPFPPRAALAAARSAV